MEYVTLSNGVKMPMLGYGVYQISADDTERCVKDALELGYRHIDTAQAYFNEQQVGNAIKASGIERKDLFLTTKVWISNAGEEKAYDSILRSLERLQTKYVDLLLIHQDFGDVYGTWRAMTRAYREGKARAIGVSNFTVDRFIDFCEFNDVKPMVNQLETHVFYQQKEAREIAKKYGTVIEAWAPLAEGKNNLFNNPTLTRIGQKYGKTAAQVALRFLIQIGVTVFPKSVHKERMQQNLDTLSFELSPEDMKEIEAMDTNKSLFIDFRDPSTVDGFIKFAKSVDI